MASSDHKKSKFWYEWKPLGADPIKVGSPDDGAKLTRKRLPNLSIRTRSSRTRSSR